MSMIDKDPWCCAGDKLRINIDGFDAGYINALRSARHLVRALSKDDALAVSAMDGCPWVEKGRAMEVADGIAELVDQALSEVDSVRTVDGVEFTQLGGGA